MTTRRRLARLERLERLQPTPSCPWFIIAPERAQAIIAAYNRLGWSGNPDDPFGPPDPAVEEETAARLAELLREVRCPPDNLITTTGVRSRETKPSNCERV